MISEKIYNTRSIDFATLLRYAFPDGHLATVKEEKVTVFYFDGFDECKHLASSYWCDEPLAIGNLRAYNEAGRAVRVSMKTAHQQGRWNRDDYEEVTG